MITLSSNHSRGVFLLLFGLLLCVSGYTYLVFCVSLFSCVFRFSVAVREFGVYRGNEIVQQ